MTKVYLEHVAPVNFSTSYTHVKNQENFYVRIIVQICYAFFSLKRLSVNDDFG